MKKLFSLIFLLPLLFFSSSTSKAASGNIAINLTVSPVVLDLTTNPGQKFQGKIRIRNNSEVAYLLDIGVYKLLPQGENGESVPVPPDPGDDFVNWVSFETPSFTARPREWTDLKFSINVPASAGFGYYYAFKIAPPEKTENDTESTQLQGQIIIPTLLNVKKEGAVAKADLLDFKPKAFVNEYLPVEFITNVRNSGNIHIKPRGTIFVKNLSGKDIATIDLNTSNGNVLPGTNRVFENAWNDGFAVKEEVSENGTAKLDKNNKPVKKLHIYWNRLTSFRFGKYTAKAVVVYNDGIRDIPLESTTSFWVIPYKILSGIVIVLIALVLFIRYLLKWYVKQQIRKLSLQRDK